MVSTLWYCFQFIPVLAQGDWPRPDWGFESKLEIGEFGDGANDEVEGNFRGCLLRVSPSIQDNREREINLMILQTEETLQCLIRKRPNAY